MCALVGFSSNGEEGNRRKRKKKQLAVTRSVANLKKKEVGEGVREGQATYFSKCGKMEMEMQREWG